MYGFKIFSGLWRSFLRGLNSRYPSHHGQTLWLMLEIQVYRRWNPSR
jgi:hypothetical protein